MYAVVANFSANDLHLLKFVMDCVVIVRMMFLFMFICFCK